MTWVPVSRWDYDYHTCYPNMGPFDGGKGGSLFLGKDQYYALSTALISKNTSIVLGCFRTDQKYEWIVYWMNMIELLATKAVIWILLNHQFEWNGELLTLRLESETETEIGYWIFISPVDETMSRQPYYHSLIIHDQMFSFCRVFTFSATTVPASWLQHKHRWLIPT